MRPFINIITNIRMLLWGVWCCVMGKSKMLGDISIRKKNDVLTALRYSSIIL